MANEIIYKTLFRVGNNLLKELGLSLIRKQRKASGNLINSMKTVVTNVVGGVQLEVQMLKYWRVVNDGVEADRVPYNRGSGARNSKYIKALIKWLKIKGIGSSLTHIRSIAFAIATKHKREGIPLDKNKLGFVDDVLETNILDDLRSQVLRAQSEEIKIELRKTIPKEIGV